MKPHDTCFQVLRIYVFANIAIMYAFVFFHRTCPSIVSEDMADDYGVKKKKLGIFSSMFFYPYAVMQVFAGLLSDILNPAILVGGAQIIASIGALVCGLSNNITVGCVGRFFVGLGCGPTYVPICKIASIWFSLDYYSYLLGIILAIGGAGGIIAQYPLASFADKYGWRVAFYGIAGLGFILSVLILIFCRNSPEDRGYEPVNKDLQKKEENITVGERLSKLGNNFLVVIKRIDFWWCAVYIFFKDGPFFDISGLWAGPYLQDVYGYSKGKTGVTLIGLSIGMIVGSFAYPPISGLLKTRKWILTASSGLACIILIVISVEGPDVPYGLLYVFFIFLGITLNAATCIVYSLVREYYDPAIAGTSIGLGNFFAFLASAIYQTVSSEVIPSAGHNSVPDDPDKEIYLEKGYRNGLWIICAVSCGVGAVFVSLATDTSSEKKEEKKEEGENKEGDNVENKAEGENVENKPEENKEEAEKNLNKIDTEKQVPVGTSQELLTINNKEENKENSPIVAAEI